MTELAKPTAKIERSTVEPTLDLDTLVKQFMSKQEAFNEFMDILQLLHERGILTAFKAALERYEDLLGVVADWLEGMGAQSPTNLFELLNAVAKADIQGLSVMISAVSKGAASTRSEQPPSLEALLKSLEDENVRRGLWAVIQTLKEIGSSGRK